MSPKYGELIILFLLLNAFNPSPYVLVNTVGYSGPCGVEGWLGGKAVLRTAGYSQKLSFKSVYLNLILFSKKLGLRKKAFNYYFYKILSLQLLNCYSSCAFL